MKSYKTIIKWWGRLSFLFFRLRLWLLTLSVTLILLSAGCSQIPSFLLGGGGPSVAANVQAGKTNSQTIGASNNISPTIRNSTIDSVDQSNTTNNELPSWVWTVGLLLLVVGWCTDTPGTILKNLRRPWR